MVILKEENLYIPVKNYLEKQGFIVRAEVKDCDVTAIKDEKLVVIELKKNLSVALLAQAVKRQKSADFVYVAVPKPSKFKINSKWRDIINLLKSLSLGLMLVSFVDDESYVEVALEAKDKLSPVNRKKKQLIIKEASERTLDLNKGGSTRKKLVTAYREKAVYIGCCLSIYGSLSTKKLRELGCDKKVTSILYENYYGWFNNECRSVYGITDKGQEEIRQYTLLFKQFEQKIKKMYGNPHTL